MMDLARAVVIILTVGAIHGARAQAPVYKSVDEEGKVTYSATPPAGGGSVEKVEIPPGPTAEQTRQTEERLERYRTQTKEWKKEREARRPAKKSSAGQTVDVYERRNQVIGAGTGGKPTLPIEGEPTPPIAGKPTPPIAGKPTPPIEGKPTPPIAGKPTPPIAPGKQPRPGRPPPGGGAGSVGGARGAGSVGGARGGRGGR